MRAAGQAVLFDLREPVTVSAKDIERRRAARESVDANGGLKVAWGEIERWWRDGGHLVHRDRVAAARALVMAAIWAREHSSS